MAGGRHLFLYCALLTAFVLEVVQVEAVVIVTKDNSSILFDSADASFTPKAPSSGICGTVVNGNPINGCTSLSEIFMAPKGDSCSVFALVSRGGCSFDTKVRRAQEAGFTAILVADNIENGELITMAGNKRGVEIPAVFVSKMAGDVLTQFSNDSYAECCILPSYENVAWLVMVVSFISLIAITAIFAICFLIRQQRTTHMRGRGPPNSQRISYQTVKCLPTIIYDSRYERGGSFDVCAVCLEDYADGAVLRTLPCNHRFHCSCIDAWLTNWQAFCPICKQDVDKVPSSTESRPSSTESTPLLPTSNNAQQLVASSQESSPYHAQESCTVSNSLSQTVHDCRFSFSHPPLESRGTSIRGLRQARNFSLDSLTDQDSMEAFRASPYFTPPSSFHSSAPNVLSLLNTTSNDKYHHDALGTPSQNGRHS